MEEDRIKKTTRKITKKRTNKKNKTKIEPEINEVNYDNVEFKNEENMNQQIQQTPSKYLKVETINSFKETNSQVVENEIDLIKQQIKELIIENNDLKIKMAKMEKRLNNIINHFNNPQQIEDLNIDTELSYKLNSE